MGFIFLKFYKVCFINFSEEFLQIPCNLVKNLHIKKK